jgi:hypothetical protein
VQQAGLDTGAELAAEVLGEVYLDHELGRMKELRAPDEPGVRAMAGGHRELGGITHPTLEESEAVAAELRAVTDRFRDRAVDPHRAPGTPVRCGCSSPPT